MTARRHIGTDERRARLGIRHRLAGGAQATTVAEAAASLVALHATDAASVFLQARVRTTLRTPVDIARELYEERSVLRMLAMRRTLFLVPIENAAIVHAAASRAVGEVERRRTIAMLAHAGIGPDPAALLEELEDRVLAAVRERGEATTAELTATDPRLGHKVVTAPGKPYQGTLSVSQKVVVHLALDGRIARGRPRGTWIASQFRWSPIERWLPDGIAALPVDQSRAALVRHWLRAFGPGTREDLRWWMGWTVAAVRQSLDAARAVEVDLEGGVGYVLPDDLERVTPPEPWVALLPALDATTMGWPAATGTSARTGPRCSTPAAMPGPRSGSTAGWSAAGRTGRPAKSCPDCWRTWAGRPCARSTRRPLASRRGWAPPASAAAFRRRSRSIFGKETPPRCNAVRGEAGMSATAVPVPTCG